MNPELRQSAMRPGSSSSKMDPRQAETPDTDEQDWPTRDPSSEQGSRMSSHLSLPSPGDDANPRGPHATGNTSPSQVPRTIGGIKIIRVLGRGGNGIVYEGVEPILERSVALKILLRQSGDGALGSMRLIREAKNAASIRHENVMALHDVRKTRKGRIHLVMEYIPGRSLQHEIKTRGPLPPRDIARIAMQVARGLAAAHALDIVHRDIKPANVLIENSGRVVICDFGLARAGGDPRLTRTGAITGTPAYMSPEQARGDRVDHRSDLFSLGSVIFAMCTGRHPFGARSLDEPASLVSTLWQIVNEPFPTREFAQSVPGWLVAIIERLHAKSPDDRFHSATEVAELLQNHLDELP